MLSEDLKQTFDARLSESINRLTGASCHTIPEYVLDQIDKTEVDELDIGPATERQTNKISQITAKVYVKDNVYYVLCHFNPKGRYRTKKARVVFAVQGSSNFADFISILEQEMISLTY